MADFHIVEIKMSKISIFVSGTLNTQKLGVKICIKYYPSVLSICSLVTLLYYFWLNGVTPC